MGDRHPVDAQGRALPHPAWPGDRVAPGGLELVRRFCNSVNRENDAERFHDAAAFDTWLVTEGVPASGATDADLARVLAVREALHHLVVANGAGVPGGEAWERFVSSLPAAPPVRFAATADGVSLVPGDRVDGFLTRLGLVVAAAVADGTWPRLKACRHCHWVVYDPSKNRSARWCSMSACGGRHNAREYRRRQRGDGSG